MEVENKAYPELETDQNLAFISEDFPDPGAIVFTEPPEEESPGKPAEKGADQTFDFKRDIGPLSRKFIDLFGVEKKMRVVPESEIISFLNKHEFTTLSQEVYLQAIANKVPVRRILEMLQTYKIGGKPRKRAFKLNLDPEISDEEIVIEEEENEPSMPRS